MSSNLRFALKPNIRMITSRGVIWAGHVADMDGMICIHNYDQIHRRKAYLGIRRLRWEGIIERDIKK
jgi:hypothetical protein